MKKQRIAIIAEKLYGGGVERILQTFLRNFNHQQYDVYLYSSYPENLDPLFYPEGLKTKAYFNTFKPGAPVWKKIAAKILNKIKLIVYYHLPAEFFYRLFIYKRFDIVIAFLEGYATRIASGAHHNTKKIAWIHTDIINYHWTDVAFRSIEEEKKCYKKFSNIVCVAESVKTQADKYLQEANKTIVIYNPIDRDRLIKLSEENIKPKKHTFQMLIVGTLNENKGQLRLLHILAQMLKENSDIGLWIVGDGEYRGLIKETILNLGLEKNVEMFGYQTNPYPFFKKCDLYVCASYAEGFNTTITEALVLGVPVVSTLCSGVKEQLGQNSEYGLVANNDEISLRVCLEQMLDPQVLQKYRIKSEERGSDFCICSSMEKIASLLSI